MPDLPYTPKKSMVLHVIGLFGGLVKWDHASMAWMSQEFDSPILHQISEIGASYSPQSGCSLVWLKAPALGAGDREFESHFPDQFSLLLFLRLASQGKYCKLSW